MCCDVLELGSDFGAVMSRFSFGFVGEWSGHFNHGCGRDDDSRLDE